MPPVPPPTSFTWVALAAFIVGGLVRALKSDALAAILTRFFRPDGPPITIPTRVLPWLALTGGGGLAFLEAMRDGSSYGDAAKAAVLAAALAVLGHELLSGVPGVSKLLGGILVVVGLAGGVSACSVFTRENAKSALDAIQVACVMSSTITDEKEVADACGVARDLIPVLKNLIGQREAARRSGVHWGRSLDAGATLDADAPDGGR
jgi:hypothetical protein